MRRPNLASGDGGPGAVRRCDGSNGAGSEKQDDQDAILSFQATQAGLDLGYSIGVH